MDIKGSAGKENFFGLSLREVAERVSGRNLPLFVSRQLWQWVYHKLAFEPERWSNISRINRLQLMETFSFELPQVVRRMDDGQGTSKYVLLLEDQELVECVVIPEKGHITFCVSSQVGCPLACRFCATGRMGFRRNLAVSEILAQVLLMKRDIHPFSGKLNLVFMGMGEPLLNRENLFLALDIIGSTEGLSVSQKNITVSTAGISAGIDELLERFPGIKLSLSLNGYDSRSREEVMPVNRREPIEKILLRLKRYRSRNRVTFEYVLLPGINDAPEHARKLAAWLRGIPCKINLIPFNPFPGAPYTRPEESVVDRFAALLHQQNYTVVVRWSKGGGIAAACGQLAGKVELEQKPV